MSLMSAGMDRYASLECLAKLATIPYELVHPYKDAVLRKLFFSAVKECLISYPLLMENIQSHIRKKSSVPSLEAFAQVIAHSSISLI
ncbi:hypothetical protein PsorP6_005289 [Peronosclerospora sorghi]|uniref:Uncharacterized protein n=1 Tax=Peronosclerospora sorghi TaxID=230839 RepID=A0ACC0W4U4_9STRA|nr:hypothetical protein PsorP6_005289 [Peronosclerospora sorghi]